MTGPSWWGRNRWSLLALAVVVPGAVLASLTVDWFDAQSYVLPNPVVVAEGATGTYQGTTFTLTDHESFAWDSSRGTELEMLEGTEAVFATIHVDATGAEEVSFGCDAVLAAPGPDGDVIWQDGSLGEISYFPPDPLESFCITSDRTEFDWLAIFVVPEGVAETTTLQITASGGSPRVLLLEW